MASLTSTAGPILSPEVVYNLIVKPLIDESIAAKVSTVTQIASHDLRIPVVESDAATGWVAEGQEIGVGDPVLSEITCTPKKLGGLVVVSNELAADSSPAALQVVGDGLLRDLKRKVDSAYFGTTVTNGPAGLGSLTTSAASAGGAWSNLDAFAAAVSSAENLHTEVSSFVTSPATALTLGTLKEYGAAGSNKALLQPDPTQPSARMINGIPLYVTPACAPDLVWAIPQQMSLFVIRQNASVVTDSSVFFTSDRVAIRATLRVSFAYPYPLSICKVTKV